MDLKLNETKTVKLNAKEKSFNFLGFTFRYDKNLFNSKTKYLNIISSKKSLHNIKNKIKMYLKGSWLIKNEKNK